MTIHESLSDRAEYETGLDSRLERALASINLHFTDQQDLASALSDAARYVAVRVHDVPASELELVPVLE